MCSSGRRSATFPLHLNGYDTFTYIASDGALTDTATVTLGVHDFCFAEITGGTVFSSTYADALQLAVDAASPGDTVKVAGECDGVQTRAGITQTVYISQSLMLRGGYTTTDWLAAPDPDTYPTLLNALGLGRVVVITVQGVTVEGFSIRNASEDGILIAAGGVTVTNNVFDGIVDAIDMTKHETQSGGTFSWGDVAIISNTFSITGSAVQLDISLDGQNTNVQVNLGDLDILSNTFYLGANGDGFDAQTYDVSHLDGGSLSVGDVTIAANEFYSGADGVNFDGNFSYLSATLVTVGGVYITDNTFQNQSDDAAYMYFYHNTYWYSGTTGTYGDVVMRDNTVVNAGDDGLHIEGHSYNRYFYDDASLSTTEAPWSR